MKKYYLVVILLGLFLQSNLFAQPAAPANLKAEQKVMFNSNVVSLSWDKVSGVTFYTVYRKDGAISSPGDFAKTGWGIPFALYVDKFVEAGHTYSYYVTAMGSDNESSPSNKVEIKMQGEPPLTGDGVIAGQVTDETTGSPCNLAAVEIVSLSTLFHKFAIVNSSGNYSIPVPAGKYIVHFDAFGYASEFYNNKKDLGSAENITVGNNETKTINAALTPILPPAKYTLSGKVKDTEGNPVAANIIAIVENHRIELHATYPTTTNSNGEYSFNLREGDSVVVFAKSMDGKTAPIFYNQKTEYAEANVILMTHNVTGVDFVLSACPVYNNSISGIVKNTSNAGIKASVTAFQLDEKKKNALYKRTVMTDDFGTFWIRNLTPGNYILLAIPCDRYVPTYYRSDLKVSLKWKDADVIKVEATSNVAGINFKMYPIPDDGFAIIKGSIKDNMGKPVNGCLVYILDENNTMITSSTSGADGSYVIDKLIPGTYTVTAEKVDFDGSSKADVLVDYQANLVKDIPLIITPLSTTSTDPGAGIITQYTLKQNYPNPFNPATTIEFTLPQEGPVTLKVYDLVGQEIADLINDNMHPGSYKVNFTADKLSSGMYYYRLNQNGNVITKKMMLLK